MKHRMDRAVTYFFEGAGEEYAKYRPAYPQALARFITDNCLNHDHALDIGCGTGQLSKLLSPNFGNVTAIDINQSQLDNAEHFKNVRYISAPASKLPVSSSSVDFIGCAQAAHWFDMNVFYQECLRVGRQGCLLSLITYGVPQLTDNVGEILSDFYWNKIHSYWPPERAHVENGYAGFDFPFSVVAAPQITIQHRYSFAELMGYIGTWSAVRLMSEAGQSSILRDFEITLRAAWEEPDRRREIIWPLTARTGRLHSSITHDFKRTL